MAKGWRLTDAEYDLLNPPEDAEFSDLWLPMGFVPVPRSRAEWLFYHLVHGLMMRYPLMKVLLYCLDKENYPMEMSDGRSDEANVL